MRQLLEGVHYCNSLGIVHRDLKQENILIDQVSDSIKIIDFGFARSINSSWPQTSKLGWFSTHPYMAPEMISRKNYNSAVDMWSIGCIFAKLVNKEKLFKASTVVELPEEIFSWEDAIPAKDFTSLVLGLGETGKDWLARLMRMNHTLRLSTAYALKHK
ncbi:hypothetical protein LguiB_018904 [Lonicera macranthoides]